MNGLLVKNIYDMFECYSMENGAVFKTATYSRKEVLKKMSQGQTFYAFCRETTQYAKLIPWFLRAKRALFIRTDKEKVPEDSFFLSMTAPRLVPYQKNLVMPWAIKKANLPALVHVANVDDNANANANHVQKA